MKIIYVILATLILTGCNSTINKKVDIKTVKEDIAEIKKKYKNEYAPEDYEAMENELTGAMFRQAMAKGKDLEKIEFEYTYAYYLNQAKKERENREIEEKKMRDALIIIVDSVVPTMVYENDQSAILNATLKNASGKTISGVEFNVKAMDMFDNLLVKWGYEYTNPIRSGQNAIGYWPIDATFDEGARKAVEFRGKVKFIAVPTLIIFSDGTKQSLN